MNPRHLSPAVDELHFTLPYEYLIGGALAFRPLVYKSVNGFSNTFWGWGAEDDDLVYRFNYSGYEVERPSEDVGRYWALPHKKRKPINHWLNLRILELGKRRIFRDGINRIHALAKVVSWTPRPLWTHLMVEVGPPPMMNCNQTHCNNVDMQPREVTLTPTPRRKYKIKRHRGWKD